MTEMLYQLIQKKVTIAEFTSHT